jgi:small subunit ribosomal protein S4
MARPSKARGKIARHLGVNVFGNPKYDRLLKKKPYGPGEPKKGRIRETEYARQLKEKQKVKFAYGLSERQFRNLFYKAKTMKGVTGHNMLILLERRLDNVVYRMGMAASRRQARQLVSHGHIHLNGRKVTIPSAMVRPGDSVGEGQEKHRDADAPARVGELVAAGIAVDRGLPGRPHRKGDNAPDSGNDPDNCRGAADRRVLLQVGPTRRQQAGGAPRHRPDWSTLALADTRRPAGSTGAGFGEGQEKHRDADAPARVGELVAAGIAVDRGLPGRPHRKGDNAPDSGNDPDNCRGAADRRVLLQVGPTRRQQAGGAPRHRPDWSTLALADTRRPAGSTGAGCRPERTGLQRERGRIIRAAPFFFARRRSSMCTNMVYQHESETRRYLPYAAFSCCQQ